MKKLTILLLLLPLAAIASDISWGVELPIKEVTVYRNQAQITRQDQINLRPGTHKLLIEMLPDNLIDESIRVSVSNIEGLQLIGINHFDKQHIISPDDEIAGLEKQIEDIYLFEIKPITDNLESFHKQKEILLGIAGGASEWTRRGDDGAELDVEQWKNAYSFIGKELRSINDSIRFASRIIDSLNLLSEEIGYRLNDISDDDYYETKTVAVEVKVEHNLDFTLQLKYNLHGAMWSPVYDARLIDDSTIVLACYASIDQRTGEDWTNVSLSLSTSNPGQKVAPDKLFGWYIEPVVPASINSDVNDIYKLSNVCDRDIDFKFTRNVDELLKQTAGVVTNSDGEILIRGGRAGEVAYIIDGVDPDDPLGILGPYELDLTGGRIIPVRVDNMFSYIFVCPDKKTIVSNKAVEKIFVAEYDLKCKITYLSRPKVDDAVYRIAEIINQDQAPLTPGPLSLFSGSDYIGKAELNGVIVPNADFRLGFGPEDGIEITRKIVAEKKSHESGIIGGDKIKHRQSIVITLKNNLSVAKTVHLEESLPQSKDSRVKIKTGKISPKYDSMDDEGIASWELTLAPHEELTLTIPIKIEYKKGTQITGL